MPLILNKSANNLRIAVGNLKNNVMSWGLIDNYELIEAVVNHCKSKLWKIILEPKLPRNIL